MTTLSHLECSLCGQTRDAGRPVQTCACGGPLLARYDLAHVRSNWNREWLMRAPSSMWRYAPVLPVGQPEAIVTLGEGFSPLLRTPRLGAALGLSQLWIKNEGPNPTGSFKARGMSCAISRCAEMGIRKVALASTGNAAGALAAYAAAAGIEARLAVPRDAPLANYLECRAFGAELTLTETGGERADSRDRERFDLGEFEEPYRLEGTKTLGYELAEQFQWRLPDAVVCPVGSGLALSALWKAFEELEEIGWISPARPRMIAVQTEGCQPVVRAWQEGAEHCAPCSPPATLVRGLRFPSPRGGVLALRAVRASGGSAVAVSDDEVLEAALTAARAEGLFLAPEGAAAVASLRRLLASGVLEPEQRIVVLNTGSGLKHLEAYSTRFPRAMETDTSRLGGLITPR